MIQIFRKPDYEFIGRRRWAYTVSVVFLAIGLISLAVRGLHYDIDFTGGTLVQVRFEQAPDVGRIRAALGTAGMNDSIIQEFGDRQEYIVRLPLASGAASEETGAKVRTALSGDPTLGKVDIRRVEFVGPQVGRELQLQAIYAVLVGLAGILIYVAVRFDLKGSVAAIAAVFHDVIICLGAMSLTGREFSLPVLAALLTIIGYSVNDTIVAYDRLRENRGRGQRGKSFAEQMNNAVNETLSRTVLTALTTFFSTIVLLVLGGKVLEDFAFVLVIGVITGTYSTIYVAGALVVDWTYYVEGRGRKGKKAVAKA
jgi:preprotein translocase subunit SecF